MTKRTLTIEISADTYDWLEEAGQTWGTYLGDVSLFSSGEPLSPAAVAVECVERMREQVGKSKEGKSDKLRS